MYLCKRRQHEDCKSGSENRIDIRKEKNHDRDTGTSKSESAGK